MLPNQCLQSPQIPLIHVIHTDDQSLRKQIDGEWYDILLAFDWEAYRKIGAAYYDALREFNLRESNIARAVKAHINEKKEDATQRLLFDRDTMKKGEDAGQTSVLYSDDIVEFATQNTDPLFISPGVVPVRILGRKPKCFFAMVKSFIGASLLGLNPEPENIHLLLSSNPSFARACGFEPKDSDKPKHYHPMHSPSSRKLQQFDQVMREAGLWEKIKTMEVKSNFDDGVFESENELVGDTTHYHAYSGFETVRYEDEKGKIKKKSQSKTVKKCQCEDAATCEHPWELCDDGAGTVVKSATKMVWAHKASVIGLPRQGIALDAIAVADASTHDGQTFLPHAQKVFEQYPEITESVTRALYDSACHDEKLKQNFKDQLGIELKASFNPRRSKAIKENLPRGIDKITPSGTPVCQSGFEMEYQGARYADGTFIYKAPADDDGIPVCQACDRRESCCNRSTQTGRTMTVPFETLPHIDAGDPPMAKRFKAIMKRRPSVERMIKRLKCDFGDAHLTKRGNQSFQAILDKTMISYHLLLRYLH